MRNKLEHIGKASRHTFRGEFVRLGIKNGFKTTLQTVLLKDIRDEDDELVSDHLWFNYTKGFREAELTTGDIVEFNARVSTYIKGYRGYVRDVYCLVRMDYKLSYPTNIINLSAIERHLNN